MRPDRYDPPGIEFIDRTTRRTLRLVDDDAPQWGGWLVYWHVNAANWVSLRKATSLDRQAVADAEEAGQTWRFPIVLQSER